MDITTKEDILQAWGHTLTAADLDELRNGTYDAISVLDDDGEHAFKFDGNSKMFTYNLNIVENDLLINHRILVINQPLKATP
jgi:hypothetical protein